MENKNLCNVALTKEELRKLYLKRKWEKYEK
jgi:hypothetical protein